MANGTALRSFMLALLLALLVVLASAQVRAQEATEAQLLFERGALLYRDRRFGEALEALVASNRLVPNANVVFNVAQIYELLERPMDAFNWYQRHLTFELDDQARARALERIALLLPHVAVLRIHSEPAAAELFIDRTELGAVGRSPADIAVPPGQHTIIARLRGYRDASAQTSAALGTQTETTLAMSQLLGHLELRSEPAGATVTIEGQDKALGQTPLSLDLPVGQIALAVRLDGYLERHLALRVDADAPSRTDLQLIRDPARFARLMVRATPAGARVRLDGVLAGRAPLSLEGLRPGMRALEIAQPRHESFRVALQLVAGNTAYVHALLIAEDQKPWPYWDRLGYSIAGGVFAFGAVLGIIAVTKNNAGADASEVVHLDHAADALMATGLVIGAVTLIAQLSRGPSPKSHGAVTVHP